MDYETGLDAVEELKKAFPTEDNLAPIALRWILDHPEVSTIIPGASKPAHLASNLSASSRKSLAASERKAIDAIYDERIRLPYTRFGRGAHELFVLNCVLKANMPIIPTYVQRRINPAAKVKAAPAKYRRMYW